jgi:hypothetical protein
MTARRTRPDALAHFDGVPVDLAFIDGMRLSEFAVPRSPYPSAMC